MGRRSTDVSLLIGVLLLCVATTSGANLIAYNTGTPNHNRVMVMDDTGANAVQIFVGGKFSGPLALTISPPGLDGTWVAYEDYHLYKVRADGTDPIKMLCYEGTDSNEEPYSLFGYPQWSPDGTEILVSLFRESGLELAFLPADSAVPSDATGEDCASPELVPIPYFSRTPADEWELQGTASWNDDGSQIAFFEVDALDRIHLVTLGRQNGWEPLVQKLLDPNPDFPVIYPWATDWRRGGTVLTFVSRIGGDRRPDVWLTWIDTETGEWDFFTDNGSPIEVTSDPTWSPESPSQQLIFTDSGGKLVKWTYPNGPGVVLGSGKRADWQRDALDCNITGCDDGNPCTTDTCDPNTRACDYTPNSNTCNDGNDCTYADTCTEGACSGTYFGDEEECSDGFCCGGPCSAPACTFDDECDDGDPCTTDSCNWSPCDATCQHSPDPDNPSCQAVDCSQHSNRKACNADSGCHWNNRQKMCLSN